VPAPTRDTNANTDYRQIQIYVHTDYVHKPNLCVNTFSFKTLLHKEISTQNVGKIFKFSQIFFQILIILHIF